MDIQGAAADSESGRIMGHLMRRDAIIQRHEAIALADNLMNIWRATKDRTTLVNLQRLLNKPEDWQPDQDASISVQKEDFKRVDSVSDKSRMTSQPSIISLCCGAGLGELGVKKHFKTVLAVDCWHKAVCSFKANFPDTFVQSGDIANKNLISRAKKNFGSIDGIVASPPCPGFARHDPADDRSMLLFAVMDWVEAFHPMFVVIENVKALLHAPHLKLLNAKFHRSGYKIRPWLLDAADFGAPQHRRRVFIVAVPIEAQFPSPPATTHGPGGLPYKTIKDAIGDLTESEALRLGGDKMSSQRSELMLAVPAGGNWEDLADEQREYVLGSINGKNPTKRLCRRYAWDEVVETIQTAPQILTTTFPLPPHLNRPFTVIESLRLMGVRQSFQLFGNLADRYRMVGNGICPQVMDAVCRAVMESLNPSKRS